MISYQGPTLLLALLLLGGCPSVAPSVQRPHTKLQTVRVLHASASSFQAALLLEVQNPNRDAVLLREVDWMFSLGEGSAVRGRSRTGESVRPGSTSSVLLHLELVAYAAGYLTERVAAGERHYRVSGIMHFESDLGDIAAAFEQSGSIEIQSAGKLVLPAAHPEFGSAR